MIPFRMPIPSPTDEKSRLYYQAYYTCLRAQWQVNDAKYQAELVEAALLFLRIRADNEAKEEAP